MSAQWIKAQDKGNSIIWKALEDEIRRDMDSLHTVDGPKPCFISASLEDMYSISVKSSLGGTLQADENKTRSWGCRLLVGSYKLNDENFTGLDNGDPTEFQPDNLPLDNDYYGIRRTFWAGLDQTYRSASRNYNQKIESIKKKEIDQSALEIADFADAPRVISREVPPFSIVGKDSLERYARRLSAAFRDYPGMVSSMVFIDLLVVNVYFVNSEGSEVRSQIPLLRLAFRASVYDEFGTALSNGFQYVAESLSSLPDEAILRENIRELAGYLDKLKAAPHFDDSYTGPVLFEGQSSTKVFLRALFNSENSMVAYREELVSSDKSQLYYSRNRNAFEARIGRVIAPKGFTIKDLPGSNAYDGVPLIGGYSVDAEGVRPPAELVLVENGVLKNLLSSRTPSRAIDASNGHYRFSVSQIGCTEQVAPSNILISSAEGRPDDSLKQQLIRKAKDQGLDYAILVKPLAGSNGNVPELVYKVDLQTGAEELIRAGYELDMGNVTFRDLASCSNKVSVHNMLFQGSNSDRVNNFSGTAQGIAGIPMSIIAPDAVLVDRARVTGDKKPIAGKNPPVPNPVQ